MILVRRKKKNSSDIYLFEFFIMFLVRKISLLFINSNVVEICQAYVVVVVVVVDDDDDVQCLNPKGLFIFVVVMNGSECFILVFLFR